VVPGTVWFRVGEPVPISGTVVPGLWEPPEAVPENRWLTPGRSTRRKGASAEARRHSTLCNIAFAAMRYARESTLAARRESSTSRSAKASARSEHSVENLEAPVGEHGPDRCEHLLLSAADLAQHRPCASELVRSHCIEDALRMRCPWLGRCCRLPAPLRRNGGMGGWIVSKHHGGARRGDGPSWAPHHRRGGFGRCG
jgi:hypothetical protein